jgi:hypothetical protein
MPSSPPSRMLLFRTVAAPTTLTWRLSSRVVCAHSLDSENHPFGCNTGQQTKSGDDQERLWLYRENLREKVPQAMREGAWPSVVLVWPEGQSKY